MAKKLIFPIRKQKGEQNLLVINPFCASKIKAYPRKKTKNENGRGKKWSYL